MSLPCLSGESPWLPQSVLPIQLRFQRCVQIRDTGLDDTSLSGLAVGRLGMTADR